MQFCRQHRTVKIYVPSFNQVLMFRLKLHSSLTNNQAYFFNLIPEVMCNLPERDSAEKIKSILNLCTGSLSYISIIYKYFKNINVLDHSSFARPAMFLCLGITYIKINMIFYIMLVDTMSCMWLVGSHRLVCLLVWKNNKWGTHCHLPHSENEFCVICVRLRIEQRVLSRLIQYRFLLIKTSSSLNQ